MVEVAANPNGKRTGFWLRTGLVVVTVTVTIVTKILTDYLYSAYSWYYLPYSGHFNRDLAVHYHELAIKSDNFLGGAIGICLSNSACFLSGTIYWVRRMTIKKESSSLNAVTLN